MMLPKMATDIPATIIVLGVAPSHTIRSGARADFGRLFSTTRNGSVISNSFLLNQRSVAIRILKMVTRTKLTSVSYSVIPMCRKILLSNTIPQKQRITLLGLLKIKESMIPKYAVNSHRSKNATNTKMRVKRTKLLCCFCFFKKSS